MTKKPNNMSSQLQLELKQSPKSPATNPQKTIVRPFVDSKTLEIRRKAVERVAASGIFSVSKSTKPR